jgi:hypothetical protein
VLRKQDEDDRGEAEDDGNEEEANGVKWPIAIPCNKELGSV